MVEKEKLQSLFKNFIALILEYQQVNIKMFSKNIEDILSNQINLSKQMMDLNAKFSDYQLRSDYNKDPEYIDKINRLKRELEEAQKRSQAFKDNFEFKIGQTQLDMEKLNSLIEDLNFMIEDL